MAHFLVIAAGSTVGQSITHLLKSEGHTVFTTARDKSKIDPDAILDATQFDDVMSVFEQVGDLDGVVNCSGSLLLKPAHNTSLEEWKDTINTCLTTAFATVRAAGTHMKNGGSVVLISSSAALIGIANHDAIAAAKAGIIGLIQSAAATYANRQLRFNAIAPGLTDTSLTQRLISNSQGLKISQSMHALGRIGEPMDIARAVCFLLNPENNWITGQVLAVDGGLSRVMPRLKI